MGSNSSTPEQNYGEYERRRNQERAQQELEARARLHMQYEKAQQEKNEYMRNAAELRRQAEYTKLVNEELQKQLYHEKKQKEILLNRPKQCRYESEGCKVVLTAATVELHENQCTYKDLTCPLSCFDLCKWKGRISKIYEHFQEFHADHVKGDVNKELFIPDLNIERRFLHLVKLGLFYFFVHIKITKASGLAITVQLLGSLPEANKWSYEIHVYKKNESKRKYLYISKCISIKDNVDELYEASDCAILPMAYAQTMIQGGCLYYKFYIKQVGPGCDEKPSQ